MNNKLILIGIAFSIYLFYKNKKGNVKVEPLINYADFQKWYAKTIGDYNPDGSIANENDWFQFWINKFNKG